MRREIFCLVSVIQVLLLNSLNFFGRFFLSLLFEGGVIFFLLHWNLEMKLEGIWYSHNFTAWLSGDDSKAFRSVFSYSAARCSAIFTAEAKCILRAIKKLFSINFLVALTWFCSFYIFVCLLFSISEKFDVCLRAVFGHGWNLFCVSPNIILNKGTGLSAKIYCIMSFFCFLLTNLNNWRDVLSTLSLTIVSSVSRYWVGSWVGWRWRCE